MLKFANTASLKRDPILGLTHLQSDGKTLQCAGIVVPGVERQKTEKKRNDNAKEYVLNATIPAESFLTRSRVGLLSTLESWGPLGGISLLPHPYPHPCWYQFCCVETSSLSSLRVELCLGQLLHLSWP